jgi:uncharacterized protein YebE (UPF0316 family)
MTEILTSSNVWLGAGFIFLLRIADMSLDTLRVMMIIRGKKLIAWVLGFFQAVIFIVAIASVLQNLDNPINLIAFAAGFATGIVVGMWIEERLAIGHIQMNIVSPSRGSAVAEKLRHEGYATTEIPARGKDGMVTMLSCGVLRRNVRKVINLVNQVDPNAFITTEDLQPVRRGTWRA